MKLQLIYNFYIADNECNNDIYLMHYYMLQYFTQYVDRAIFVITYDGNMNDDVIFRIRSLLINICKCNDLQIIFEYNDKTYREGIIFKKYIIDKLDQYDDYLTFFGHTKGVTNPQGLSNRDNLLKWIFTIYLLNYSFLDEVRTKLVEGDYISYGALYFKDYRHNNIHNWFYSGSFYWLNTKKLNKYIKDNNIDVSKLVNHEGEHLKRCAELFIGSCFDESLCAFHYDQKYNKSKNNFNMYGWEISYEHIDVLIKQYLNVWEYDQLIQRYNLALEDFKK